MRPVRAPLDADRQRLAEAWMPRALGTARRWARESPWLREEFEAEALLGLVKAAASFEPGRGLAFDTPLRWALRAARQRVYRAARQRVYRAARPLGWRHETSPGDPPVLHGDPEYWRYADPLSADPALVAMAGELAGRG
jgi:hypothetical protein